MKKQVSPRVAIIILNWNGLPDTVNCLESLRKTTYPSYQIVVVDNASQGNDAARLRSRFGDYIHLIENEDNYGFAEGNNIGIRYAITTLNAEYIALLNNDTTVDPAWLTELIKPFLADVSGTLAVTSSLIRDFSCPDRIQYGGDANLNIFGQCRASRRIEEDTTVRTLAGAACVISKSAIEKLGTFFCPDYFAYYEDIDSSWRLDTLGYKQYYVPTSVVFHKGGSSLRDDLMRKRIAVLSTRNKYLTFYRNLALGKLIAILPLLLGYDIFIMIAGTLYKRNPLVFVTRAQGILAFIRDARKVTHVGGGRLSYLDKRLYLDKLG
jgi:GT2 family glycosyltransferase